MFWALFRHLRCAFGRFFDFQLKCMYWLQMGLVRQNMSGRVRKSAAIVLKVPEMDSMVDLRLMQKLYDGLQAFFKVYKTFLLDFGCFSLRPSDSRSAGCG